MPNGTLRGVRGRGNYLIFLPTRFAFIQSGGSGPLDNPHHYLFNIKVNEKHKI